MNTIDAIMTRNSVRNYSDKKISSDDMETILKAAMSGPSATNARDWTFIVAQDRDVLNKMADANGVPAKPLRTAAAGILICGDLDRAFKGAPNYWIIDCAIAGQNINLTAKELGIGAVWLGTYPETDRIDALRELFGLPENIIPHSILALGYEEEDSSGRPKLSKKYEPERVHWDKW